jgi:hypothetical protein
MPKSVRLGALMFDEARAGLQKPSGPVPPRRKSYEVLKQLINRPDRLVSAEEVQFSRQAGPLCSSPRPTWRDAQAVLAAQVP